ncbi:hypothetical protein BDZ91DRAFT_697919 [Kalaharituber pfeilii]|nr:hypothetical protein BDZ91DRAFT_697919 [Kalaharituber pfeilii]
MIRSIRRGLLASLLPFFLLSQPSTAAEKGLQKTYYHPGNLLDISCLNRTIDTGEHVSDSHGTLQYLPFPTCSETNLPLQLSFLSETPLNCTIPILSDELYHLLEFYVHADSPLTCRIPRRPLGGERDLTSAKAGTSGGEEWIPLVISLAGKIELSHVHISNHLNLIVHIASDETSSNGMTIDSASAYSISPLSRAYQTKVIPGSPLPLHFFVRWYPSPTLPRGTAGKGPTAFFLPDREKGEHITIHTILYCLLSCIATAAVCAVYFRGWEFPKRLRRYDFDRRGGGGGMFGGIGGEGSGAANGGRVGYGYGGYGFGGVGTYGKKD